MVRPLNAFGLLGIGVILESASMIDAATRGL